MAPISQGLANLQATRIIEDTEYGEQTSSIKEVVLRQIKKIGDICTQEFTGGYWQKKPIKTPGGMIMSEEYKPDTREAYCNAVNFITDLVYPFSDKEFKDFINQVEKDEDGKMIKPEQNIKRRRKVFKELNIMFERIQFFEASDLLEE